MKTKIKYALATLLISSLSFKVMAMGVVDDPLVSKLTIDQLEVRNANGDKENVLEGEYWIGYDLNKIWAKFEVEGLGDSHSESDVSIWYSQAVDAFWDIQYGIRFINHPGEKRTQLGVAYKGLAPYWIDTNAELLIGEKGQISANLSFEHEYMITQKWVLIPEAKFKINTKDDTAIEVGAGLTSSEIGLRLAYEFKREFAPYIGINFNNKYGKTAQLAESSNKHSSNTQIVAGLHMWF